ncbi:MULTISPECIES: hypothetical protein [Gimesia]|uniref:Periplasmic heavy metal sensor n=2 Tax=Gimesia TaxID=1649453 RepID=A0A6I6ALV5_9PLAN|nr:MULTISPECIES: hypothetical protein [Gimesia]MBP69250.1 hypothetical protein [Haliea sp.]QDT22008.1 hypothetical protein HG66A1_38140 [Gimesia chilikensis]QGQ24748.1 hypothetical protein F1728_19555 [Gimesia benthica]QGQ26195.1 hypothetical protein F1728_27485 [Gimesia benthica]|tara:strand:- start:390 stop:1217 length:828 start_codon:yes stop_codon:yes gene_type:complete
MNYATRTKNFQIVLTLVAVLFLLSLVSLRTVRAQSSTAKGSPHTNHTSGKSTTGDQSLAAQIQDLQTKVAKLEMTLQQKHDGKMGSGMKSNPMKDMMGKGMGKKVGMGMATMSGQRMSEMGMMNGKGMSGMAMMGQMKGMGQMQMPSALPGFAGASHIYHIGATSFFLDHSQHITLTQEQQVKLNQIKEKVLLGQATFDRWISEAEQELWVLTSSDTPAAAKIETKIREIEKLRSDKRIAYIRAVGEAARVLTDEQRQTLVGNLSPDHQTTGARE